MTHQERTLEDILCQPNLQETLKDTFGECMYTVNNAKLTPQIQDLIIRSFADSYYQLIKARKVDLEEILYFNDTLKEGLDADIVKNAYYELHQINIEIDTLNRRRQN